MVIFIQVSNLPVYNVNCHGDSIFVYSPLCCLSLPAVTMASNKTLSSYDDENESKFMRKAKESPFVPIGMAGCAAVVAFGLWRLKSRGDTKMSVHLIHMRVGAQGFIVGAMTLGVIYSMYKQYLAPKEDGK
uniref:HIG1 domain-containing protein n=2 Tax=Esox lucius TaxID=8010 RepID=A0AAY5KNJ2_ESOLU